MELKKISEVKWQLPKEKGMKVPAYVFASKKLLELMKQDNTLTQLKNIASLPGVYKNALCMPDGHQGYGFPIGGVAALDYHDGGISPGGIGYDINCLTPDTRVLTPLGCFRRINDLGNNNLVANNNGFLMYKTKQDYETVSFNNGLKSSKINFVMKKDSYKEVLTIKTMLGRVIKCSKDHPILTEKGMIKAGELKINDEVVINPFIGVEHEELNDNTLINVNEFTGQMKTNLVKRGLLPLKENSKKTPYLARLIGYLLGDGTIYYSKNKGFVNFYGSIEDLEKIQEDLAIIGFKSKIYSRQRNHKITTQYGTKEFALENHELHCSSKSLARLLEKLGTPIGNKTRQDYEIPAWIMRSKRWIKRLFLSGFFSAELSKPKLMSKYNFYTPVISQNKASKYVESGHKMLEQISDLLKEFGIRVNKISLRKEYKNKQEEETYRLRLIIASDSETLINLYSRIGFDYNNKRQVLGMLATNYLLYKESIKNIRVELEKQAVILKSNGMSIKEILTELNSKMINKRFIERSVWGGRKESPRPPQGFITFKEFNEEVVFHEGLVKDKIVNIKTKDYNGPLYDINVNDEKHNFIANSFISSNCGVRLLSSNLSKKEISKKISEIVNTLYNNIPSGVGVEGKLGKLSDNELSKVLNQGAEWALNKGYATQEDLDHTEENGKLPGDANLVSNKAKKRGRDQLGSLGSGNHFLEIQEVAEIYDKEVAKGFGIKNIGQVTVMIHCGSRGLGHQVASDYIRLMEQTHPEVIKTLPDRELIYAPAGSKVADNYLKAMNSAANFAWCNRQVITHFTRQSFNQLFKQAELKQVYDVCHNICKLEEYDGKKFYLHRKGATRCMPKGHKLVPKSYKNYGQPALIPGTMGTASYIVVGQETCINESFASTAHGAGRLMSRKKASKSWSPGQVRSSLQKKGIQIKARSSGGIIEEAPGAYKDVDEVVRVSEAAGITKRIVKLKPLGVIKG